jgi:hypothetical protein
LINPFEWLHKLEAPGAGRLQEAPEGSRRSQEAPRRLQEALPQETPRGSTRLQEAPPGNSRRLQEARPQGTPTSGDRRRLQQAPTGSSRPQEVPRRLRESHKENENYIN